MKKQILTTLLVFTLISSLVCALTATVETPKSITRAYGPGTYYENLTVRNDNNVTVNVTITGFDNYILKIDDPSFTVEPDESKTIETRYIVTEPEIIHYNLNILFSYGQEQVALGAKWTILANYTTTPEPVSPPSQAPVYHSSGGGGGGAVHRTCQGIADCERNSSIDGCSYDGCNWCCKNTCTVISCIKISASDELPNSSTNMAPVIYAVNNTYAIGNNTVKPELSESIDGIAVIGAPLSPPKVNKVWEALKVLLYISGGFMILIVLLLLAIRVVDKHENDRTRSDKVTETKD